MTKIEYPLLFKPTTGGGVQTWRIWVEPGPDGSGVIHTEYGLQGGKLQHTEDRVTSGKRIGQRNETTPFEQAKAEAQSEWETKGKRKGYAEDLANSNRFDGPMLAQKYRDQATKVDWQAAYVQPKLNGFRCLVSRTADGVILNSREHGPFSLPHLEKVLLKLLPEDGMTLDGELYDHQRSLQQISSLIKRPRDESESLQLVAYDTNLAEHYRKRYIEIDRLLQKYPNPFVSLIENHQVTGESDLMTWQESFIDQGYEGAMLRWGGAPYEAGKRSKSLLKVKTFLDGEFEVVGCKEGRGTHAGMAIFSCQTKAGHTFDVTAPGTHEDKRHYWLTWKFYVGCPLTVKYQEMTRTQEPKPFHPHAVGFKEGPKLRKAIKAMEAEGFKHPE